MSRPDAYRGEVVGPDGAQAVLVDVDRGQSVLDTDEVALTVTTRAGDDTDDVVQLLVVTPATAAQLLSGLVAVLVDT